MNIKIEPRTDTKRNDGLKQFRIKVGTNDGRKFIPLDLFADPTHWDSVQQVFVIVSSARSSDIKERNKLYKKYNALIADVLSKCDDIVRDFERRNVIITPTQFVEKYKNNRGVLAQIAPYFDDRITSLMETGHTGNSNCYKNTLHILQLFDNKFNKLYFTDVNVRYVRKFDEWLQKRDCKQNTRRYYHKALRAILNLAIKDGAYDGSAYPYGKGGFELHLSYKAIWIGSKITLH